jgi:hypothetical protein
LQPELKLKLNYLLINYILLTIKPIFLCKNCINNSKIDFFSFKWKIMQQKSTSMPLPLGRSVPRRRQPSGILPSPACPAPPRGHCYQCRTFSWYILENFNCWNIFYF